jgi:CheY-like chemotaxis protein
LQNQSVNNNTFSILKPFYKRILIVDDNTDITLTFKSALEGSYDDKRFEVYGYNNPLAALSEFKPHFYDILLTDINLPRYEWLSIMWAPETSLAIARNGIRSMVCDKKNLFVIVCSAFMKYKYDLRYLADIHNSSRVIFCL